MVVTSGFAPELPAYEASVLLLHHVTLLIIERQFDTVFLKKSDEFSFSFGLLDTRGVINVHGLVGEIVVERIVVFEAGQNRRTLKDAIWFCFFVKLNFCLAADLFTDVTPATTSIAVFVP